jgi:hypothetical protein
MARPAPIARPIEPVTRSAASAALVTPAFHAGSTWAAWTFVHVAPVATFAALAWAAAAAHLARAIGPGTAAIIVTAHLARASGPGTAAIILAGAAT